jgi:hypothetical protein
MYASSTLVSRGSAAWRAGCALCRHGLAALTALALALPAAAATAPGHFASPEEAAEAFATAVAVHDEDALLAMFGSDLRTFLPPLEESITLRFLSAWAKSHRIVPGGEGQALLEVGTEGWTFPAPLVNSDAGWRFDTQAGLEEMRVRRIGRNELAAKQVVLAIFDAQREYAAQDVDGDGLLEYAPKFASTAGKRDGLYWPAAPDEAPSPLGPLLVEAQAKGATRSTGYHGYHYRILPAQGPHAQGGAYDYRVRGNMIGGFSVVAWPVKYGDSGVMTFMVNHDGVVYEKDLGAQTSKKVAAMKRFDPDSSWKPEKALTRAGLN